MSHPVKNFFLLLALILSITHPAHSAEPKKPNILLCISDDQSWPHTSAYGDPVVRTPVFDRIARGGVLFHHAFSASPSCTPSRSAILTGQHIWRLGEGGQLFGTLPAAHPIYTDLLRASGYHVGYAEKGWAPGNITAGGRTTNGAGDPYKNFADFLQATPQSQPWCFWFGSHDPHRGYEKGSGIKAGLDPKKIKVPAFLPDTPEVRSDLCDYYLEIQRFDRQVGEILAAIDRAGQTENTLVIITSDNGMPFPRAKANLYDSGTRVPLAIRWPQKIKPHRTIDDFVTLSDLAPTILEAAGLSVPQVITARSLLPLLTSEKSGTLDPKRDSVTAARERHAWCRIDGSGYPARMIRTRDFLYIRNYQPDRLPAGDPRVITGEGPFGDIDDSPTKRLLLEHQDQHPHFHQLAFGKRPPEELYDCHRDPDQIHNLAADPQSATVLRELSALLTTHLKATDDPRETTAQAPWDAWPYHGPKPRQILPE